MVVYIYGVSRTNEITPVEMTATNKVVWIMSRIRIMCSFVATHVRQCSMSVQRLQKLVMRLLKVKKCHLCTCSQ